MKRIIALTLVLAMLLCGCGSKADTSKTPETAAAVPETAAPATEAAAEPTTEPTTVPTEPEIYRNPLNGEILDAPFTGRVFANTVSNMEENLPHVGVTQADILIETFVNKNNIIRCLALFTDIESVDAIGSTRSTRPIFNQLAQHYDLILSHAGGSDQALEDAANRGIENFNIDAWVVASTGASYRDQEHKRSYENTLYGIGSGLKAYAESQGMPMTLERDYGLTFTEDGTPAGGEDASKISLTFTYGQAKKQTVMTYDAEAGKYAFNQYGKVMKDLITEETEMFRNVIIMNADITTEGIYFVADFNAGGSGYFACGGKLIPITWTCGGDKAPFCFFTADGEPLDLGVGNTYIAICTPESPVTWEA
ncbi:MAG: DUF3048 domain-containing protein [Faecousia sp.]